MKKMNSLGKRTLAALLCVLMVLGMIPADVAWAETADPTRFATVTTYTGGEVTGNGTSDVTVTVTETSLNWVEGNDLRAEGWWVGINVTAPEGASAEDLEQALFRLDKGEGLGEAMSFMTYRDSDTEIQMWFSVSPEGLEEAKIEGRNLTRVYEFDWAGDGEYEQSILFQVVPSEKIVLNKDGEQNYPGTYGTVETYTGGEIVGNGTSDVSVTITETILNWVEATDTHEAGWWVGINVTAPVGLDAATLEQALFRLDKGEGLGEAMSFMTYRDSDTEIQMWFSVSPEGLEEAKIEGRNLTRVYEFDWAGDGEYEQSILFQVVPSEKIVLNKDGEQNYPGTYGTVETYTGGEIVGNGTSDVSVTITETILNWVEATDTHEAGWWVGINVTAPVGLDAATLEQALFRLDKGEGLGEAMSFMTYRDSDTEIQMWFSVSPEGLEEAKIEGRNLTRVYEFDWAGDGEYEQSILFQVVPSEKIVLNKDGEQNYPGTYGTVETYTGGEIVGNGTSDVSVTITETILNWVEATDTHEAGWWVGINMTAPVGLDAATLEQTLLRVNGGEGLLFNEVKDGEREVQLWFSVSPETLKAGETLGRTYEFDWNGDGEYEQTVVFSLIPSEKIVLNKGGEQVHPLMNLTLTVNGDGKIKVDGVECGSGVVTVTKDKVVSIELVPGDHTRVAVIKLNGEVVDEIPSSFSADAVLEVTFVTEYTVTVNLDGNGSVTADGNDVNNGSYVFEKGDGKLILVATPAIGYRVSSVTVDDVTTTFDTNAYVHTMELSKDMDHAIEVTFADSLYDVTISGMEHGIVAVNKNQVEHGAELIVSVTPDDGYELTALIVGDDRYAVEDLDDNGSMRFVIKADTQISAVFTHTADAHFGNIDISGMVRQNGYTYVFANDGKIQISLSEQGKDGYTCIRLAKVGKDGKYKKVAPSDTPTNVLTLTAEMIKDTLRENPGEFVIDGKNYVLQIGKPKKNGNIRWEDATQDGSGKAVVITISLDDVDPVVDSWNITDDAYYNADVPVELTVSDAHNLYSGIKFVDYIISDTDNVNENTVWQRLYTSEPTNGGDKTVRGLSFTVSAETWNKENVYVIVKVTDYAGNEFVDKRVLHINTVVPSITISVEDTVDPDAVEGYYNKRVAFVTVNDESYTFDWNNLKIVITDAEGNRAEGYGVSRDGQTATIVFDGGSSFKWSVSYVNKAGSAAIVQPEDASIYEFVVDSTDPTAEVQVGTHVWNEILEKLTFGIFNQVEITACLENVSDVNPYKVEYYVSNDELALSETALEELYQNGAFTSGDSVTVSEENHYCVYFRVTDKAGNEIYLNSDGLIVDRSQGSITLTQPNENGVYNKNYAQEHGTINVDILVKDAEVNGTYSGLKLVEYWMEMDGLLEAPINLFTFDNADPAYADLVPEFRYTVQVDPSLYNSSNVILHVRAVDNAGKEFTNKIALDIDVTAPTIQVNYKDTNAPLNVKFFQGQRLANITITERVSHFDAAAATAGITITAVDSNGKAVDLDTQAMISDWVTIEGATSDEDTHTATITYTADGNYTFAISYTDKAGNGNEGVDTGDSRVPYEFTVDNTKPEGEVQVGEKVWNEILEKLSFGIFSQDEVVVYTRNLFDATSPYTVEYYVANDELVLSETALEDLYWWNSAFTSGGSVTVSKENRYSVYFRITDYAGNYVYRNCDGVIIDDSDGTITLIPEEPNKNGIYGLSYAENEGTIDIDVLVQEKEVNGTYSGLKLVEYWMELDGVEETPINLFTFDNAAPSYAELVPEFKTTIEVNPYRYNSTDVVVHVRAEDNAGNVFTDEVKLDIDVTAPTIEVSYEDDVLPRNEKYFQGKRVATITIIERANHFDKAAASMGITVTRDGQPVDLVAEDMFVDWDSDGDIHIATITYTADGNYTFAISYTDMADNENVGVETGDSKAPYEFAVDNTDPAGTVTGTSDEGRETIWDDLIGKNKLTFGFWSKLGITITGTSEDVTSPIESVEYYKTAATEALDEAALNEIQNWTPFDALRVNPSEQFTIYLKITDYAGNVKYISTDGMIVDSDAPVEEVIAPEISIEPEQPINGIYSGDVDVTIQVADPLVGETFAGLKSVRYEVWNLGEMTQSGELFAFDVEEPTNDQLRQVWEDMITVSSALNNSNDVEVIIYAEDNAGNTSFRKIELMIDTTAPTIEISYDNNKCENGFYYDAGRTATIVITERNFNTEDVKFLITNTDGVMPKISNWVKKTGTGNLDDTTYTATITYYAEGDYEFAVSYIDLAGWDGAVSYAEDTTNPQAFTIDMTAPVLNVQYANTDVKNTIDGRNYFDKTQTATITVKEHNFHAKNVNILVGAVDVNGNAVSVTNYAALGVTTGAWKNVAADTYELTLIYGADANYTFDIEYQDLAANKAADYTEDLFTVDATAPELLEVSYSANVFEEILESVTFGYYDAAVTVTIKASDDTTGIYHFAYSYLNSEGVSDVNAELLEQTIRDAEITYDGASATATFSIPKAALEESNQFNGTVEFTAYDRSENSTKLEDSNRIVVDSISPSASITYNEPVNSANGTSYYDGEIQAAITITEANFDSADVVVTVTKDGETYPVTVTWQDANVDEHIGSFVLTEDGDYIVSVEYTDKSGNVMNTYTSNRLTLDTVVPQISATGIKANSANKDEIYTFTLRFTDINLDAAAMKPVLMAVVKGEDGKYTTTEIALGDAQAVIEGKEYVFTVEDLPLDALYTLTAEVQDMSGNIMKQVMLEDGKSFDQVPFSINRDGSTFGFGDKATEELIDQYYVYSVGNDVVIVETNVDPIEEYVVKLNGKELVEGTDFTTTQTSNAGEWSKRTYVLNKALFEAEGEYSIVVSSIDKANTTSFSDVKDLVVAFVVDRTPPTLTISGLENGGRYQTEEQTVTLIPSDEGGRLDSLSVIVLDSDGNPLKDESGADISVRFEMSGEELLAHLEENGGKITFTIPEGLNNQVKIICNDCAEGAEDGTNEYNETFTRVTVSQSGLVIFYANTPLFIGAIAGVLLLLFLIIFLILRKKNKKDEKENKAKT